LGLGVDHAEFHEDIGITSRAALGGKHRPANSMFSGRSTSAQPEFVPLRKDAKLKLLAAAIASLSWMVSACAQADKTAVTPRSNALPPVLTLDDVRMVAPALERYT
jgi:hypothetical protein